MVAGQELRFRRLVLKGSVLFSDLFQTLSTSGLREGGDTSLRQGVAILPSQNLQVSPSYLDLVQTKFGVTVQSLSYSVPLDAIDAINLWVQRQTGDQVQELVSNLDPQTQLLLATVASYQSLYHLLECGVTQQCVLSCLCV